MCLRVRGAGSEGSSQQPQIKLGPKPLEQELVRKRSCPIPKTDTRSNEKKTPVQSQVGWTLLQPALKMSFHRFGKVRKSNFRDL